MATTFLKPQNNATGVLLSAISPSSTDATLAASQGALFPSTFPFHISIDNEIARVTGRSSDILTLGTRGVENTTAASHSANAAVNLNVTAQQITDIHAAIGTLEGFTHNSGTYAAYDTFYATGGSQTARLAVGGTGQFLGVNTGGSLSWQNPGGAAWKVDQTPTGTINSSNTLFVVPDAVYVANSLQVYRNGVLMTHGSDYTETSPTGGSFTIVTAPTAGTDVFLRCNYLISATPSANADTVDGIHASSSATANYLLSLNSSSQFPRSSLFYTAGEVACSSQLVLSGVAQIPPGMTTGTIVYPVASYVFLNVVLDLTNTNANFSYAYPNLDTSQYGSANIKCGIAGRTMISGQWIIAVPSGSHSISISSLYTAGGGGTIAADHSRMTWFSIPQ